MASNFFFDACIFYALCPLITTTESAPSLPIHILIVKGEVQYKTEYTDAENGSNHEMCTKSEKLSAPRCEHAGGDDLNKHACRGFATASINVFLDCDTKKNSITESKDIKREIKTCTCETCAHSSSICKIIQRPSPSTTAPGQHTLPIPQVILEAESSATSRLKMSDALNRNANKANQGPPVYDDRNLVVNTGAPKDPPCSCPSSTCYRHREYSVVPGTSNLLAPRQPNRLLKEQVCFRVMYTIIRILILTSFWHSIIHPLEYKIIRKI